MTELARGFYTIGSGANLRWLPKKDGSYPAMCKLAVGDLVYAVGGQPQGQASYFDGNAPRTPGWRTDHTWVVALSTMEDDGTVQQGWVDNDRMAPARDDVTPAFQAGDVLYGRREAREPWVQRISQVADFESKVAGQRHNIIDDLNNALLFGKTKEADVEKFAAFLEKMEKTKASSLRIRRMCKCGLTYITSTCGRTVHFVLDGLDAKRVMAEAGVNAQQGLQGHGPSTMKYCTGAEMRRLMRQRMHDEGKHYGSDYGIDLTRVKFYLSMSRVPAPWQHGAPDQWTQAWRIYGHYRQSKPHHI